MPHSLADPRTLTVAVAAEIGLGALGWGLAWLFELPVAHQFPGADQAAQRLAWGVTAALPMVACFFLLLRARWRPLAQLRRQVRRMVHDLLDGAGLGAILLVSLAAGFGEELLFRGALQPLLGLALGPWGGVAVASLLFGLAHPMSATYFWLATLCGVYLGAITLWTDDLIPAITAHAVYDCVALWWLSRNHSIAQRRVAEDL